MHNRTLIQRAFPVTVMGVALALMSSAAAFGQNSTRQEVSIQGTPIVTTEGPFLLGGDQRLQLSQKVNYSDLNLATPSGVAALKGRIRDTASSICDRLSNDYRVDNTTATEEEDQRDCVDTAVHDALSQVRHTRELP